jgi:RNA polymerase sigma factor (sigma-70 family)
MTVFTRLLDLEHQGKFPAPENWLAYLRRAVTNAAIDIVRRNRPATMVSLDAPEHHSDQDEHQIHATPGALTDPTGDAAVERVDNDRMLVRLRAALDGLPARQRTAVIGRMNERTLPDIGAELGVSGPRVSQMYNEALEQLRRELTRADA